MVTPKLTGISVMPYKKKYKIPNPYLARNKNLSYSNNLKSNVFSTKEMVTKKTITV